MLLQDAQGKTRATLGLAASGSPGFSLSDPAGKARAIIGSAQFGSRKKPDEVRNGFSLDLYDEGDTLVWRAP